MVLVITVGQNKHYPVDAVNDDAVFVIVFVTVAGAAVVGAGVVAAAQFLWQQSKKQKKH